MSTLYQLKGNGDSPTLTLTKDYLIINGPHKSIVNGYAYNKNSAVSIKTKDIISAERKYVRSKRSLVACLILFCLIRFLIWLASAVSNAGKTVSKAINTLENIQYWTNGIINNDEAAVNELASIVGYSAFNEIVGNSRTSDDIFSAVKKAVDKALAITDSSPSNAAGVSVLVVICVLLFAGSAVFLVMYLIKPTATILISSLGYCAAIPCKSYQKHEVTQFVSKCVEIAL